MIKTLIQRIHKSRDIKFGFRASQLYGVNVSKKEFKNIVKELSDINTAKRINDYVLLQGSLAHILIPIQKPFNSQFNTGKYDDIG